MSTGIAACAIGVLGIVVLLSFPTLALILGVVAVIVGITGRRRQTFGSSTTKSPQPRRWNTAGIVIGLVAISATLVVVFVSSV